MKHSVVLLVLGVLALVPVLADQQAHQSLSLVLKNHVRDGKVDYEGIRQENRQELQAFVNSLALATPDSMGQQEQIAFWLDAYNGLVIYQVVEENDQPDSARTRGRFFRGRRYQVAGQTMTLDDIEHRALRPLAQDPRVHFVLVCGAQSCPSLQASSFLGTQDLNQVLDDATRDFVNDPRHVTVDVDQRTLYLSQIFEWYAEDFGDVLKFVAQYRPANDRDRLLVGDWKIAYRKYDWNLNESEK
jgi:hypothetical protein